jgi:hypothetical protein
MLGIPRATFYRWYDLYQIGGPEALSDRPSRPRRVWNRIPDEVRSEIITLALEEPELSPRELAVRFTDERRYFVSEASVYRLLKAHDLITSPAYIVIKAAEEFHDKTTAPNQLGLVTGIGARSQRPERRVRLGRSCGRLPCKGGLGPERLERAAGDEVALKGERVVNR